MYVKYITLSDLEFLPFDVTVVHFQPNKSLDKMTDKTIDRFV